MTVAQLAAAQAIFVEDVDGDGVGELLAGMGGSTGAILVNGRNFTELSTYGAAPMAQSWVPAVGIGNSLPQANAVLVQKDYGRGEDEAGIFFFDSTRRGTIEIDEADASYRVEPALLLKAGVGDLDGDGLDDLVANLALTEGGCEGISLSPAPFEGVRIPADDPYCIRDTYGGIGRTLTLADVDLDGYLDLLARDQTAIRVFRGPIVQNLEPTDAWVSVRDAQTILTFDVLGDFDGDGLQDLALGAPDARNGDNSRAGWLYVLLAPTGELDLEDSDTLLEGEKTDDQFGYAIAGVGDVNDDGRDDLAVGAPGADRGGQDAGAVYLFLGR